MMKRITDKVWKINAKSNIYFLDLGKKIIIDAGDRSERENVKMFLKTVIDPEKIDIIILTHLHYDHIGNIDLFPNAKIYAGAQEIMDFKKDALGTCINDEMITYLQKKELIPLPDEVDVLKIIPTPGHTKGSVCVWYASKKILFSGDTIFDKRILGRTDLPTSDPDVMARTLITLSRYPYEILCPGHDY